MSMVAFYTKFPDLAFKEMRTITVRGHHDIPDGEYGFLEFYCDEGDCDCRRVMIDVVSPAAGPKICATINYGWESVAFYQRWLRDKEDAAECKGPSLDPLNPQTEYSPALLRLFEFVLQDEAYVERLKRHYQLFKSALREEHRSKGQGKNKARRFRWRKR